MDDTEMVGSALSEASDPLCAAEVLEDALKGRRTTRAAMRAVGVDPELFEVIRRRLGDDTSRIEHACLSGAAWARGLRSVSRADPWELVATLPSSVGLPAGLKHTTGETLMHLITGATKHLKAVAPYITQGGLNHLSSGLAAATSRGVQIEIMIPFTSAPPPEAFARMLETVREEGDPGRIAVVRFRNDAPWAHLKVLTADSTAAYVGSANLTSSGMGGRNLEMGVLVRGSRVAVIERVLDLFKDPVRPGSK